MRAHKFTVYFLSRFQETSIYVQKIPFYYPQKVTILNNIDARQKMRRGVGASCLLLIFYLHQDKFIADKQPSVVS